MKTSITLDEVIKLKRCNRYSDKRVKKLFGRKTKATALDILTDVRLPDKDKVWLICFGGFLDKPLAVDFAKFCAENARQWAARAEKAERAAESAAQVEFLRKKLRNR